MDGERLSGLPLGSLLRGINSMNGDTVGNHMPEKLINDAAPLLLDSLEECVRLIENEIPYPEIDHICGTPDACCDGSCVDAAILSRILANAKTAIRKAKGLPA